MITPADITVITPFGNDGMLGKALNKAIKDAPTEWVLVHDDDVLLKLHVNWRLVCAAAINKHPDAGLFYPWVTALCASTTTAQDQLVPKGAPKPFDGMDKHIACAKEVWKTHGYSVTEIPNAQIGGACHLTSKTAWTKSGGYPGIGMFDEDHGYCRALTAAGYSIYRIDGLYIYHLGSIRGHRESSFIPGECGSKEIRAKK